QRPRQTPDGQTGNIGRPAARTRRAMAAATGLVHSGTRALGRRCERDLFEHTGGCLAGPARRGISGQSPLPPVVPFAATTPSPIDRQRKRDRLAFSLRRTGTGRDETDTGRSATFADGHGTICEAAGPWLG